MDEAIRQATVIAPLTLGLVEVAKRAGVTASRWLPVLALVIGVAVAFLIAPNLDWRTETATGLVAGLAASGIYSGVKSVAGQ